MTKEIPQFTDKIYVQILIIRDAGITNMFDIKGVLWCAQQLELNELVDYLKDKRTHNEYLNFILSGKRPV